MYENPVRPICAKVAKLLSLVAHLGGGVKSELVDAVLDDLDRAIADVEVLLREVGV